MLVIIILYLISIGYSVYSVTKLMIKILEKAKDKGKIMKAEEKNDKKILLLFLIPVVNIILSEILNTLPEAFFDEYIESDYFIDMSESEKEFTKNLEKYLDVSYLKEKEENENIKKNIRKEMYEQGLNNFKQNSKIIKITLENKNKIEDEAAFYFDKKQNFFNFQKESKLNLIALKYIDKYLKEGNLNFMDKFYEKVSVNEENTINLPYKDKTLKIKLLNYNEYQEIERKKKWEEAITNEPLKLNDKQTNDELDEIYQIKEEMKKGHDMAKQIKKILK